MTDQPEQELKPCPFCGEAPDYSERMDEDLTTHNQVLWKGVSCSNGCAGFSIPDDYDCGSAVEQWNTRSPTPPASAIVEAAAKIADEVGASYGEDETGWFECSECIAKFIRAMPLSDETPDYPDDISAKQLSAIKELSRLEQTPDANSSEAKGDLVERLRGMAYVPGVAECAKCGFQLIKSNLNVGLGTITAGQAIGEVCPNDGAPMWQVSYKDWATENEKAWEYHLTRKETTIAASLEVIKGLVDALKPLAGFMTPGAPPNHIITKGSSMAQQQITVVDCQVASQALSTATARIEAMEGGK